MITERHKAHEFFAAQRLLRLPEVVARTGLGKSSIYKRIAAGTFPAPVPLTATARAWCESEVMAWVAERVAERDAGGAR